MVKRKNRKQKSLSPLPSLELQEGDEIPIRDDDGELKVPLTSETVNMPFKDEIDNTNEIADSFMDKERRKGEELKDEKVSTQEGDRDNMFTGHADKSGDNLENNADETENCPEKKPKNIESTIPLDAGLIEVLEPGLEHSHIQEEVDTQNLSKEKQVYDVAITPMESLPSEKEKNLNQDEDDSLISQNDATICAEDFQEEEKTLGTIELSEGPYSLINLIDNIPVMNPEMGQDDSVITYIEAWDKNLYIGTNKGELIHMFKIDEDMGYIVVSRQPFSNSKEKPIDKILLLPEISKALVLSGSVIVAYVLPELSPANIGKMKDVTDMSIDYDDLTFDDTQSNKIIRVDKLNGEPFIKVTVFTKKSIRLIRVFDHSIKLFKDVHYPQSLVGAQRANFAAVSSSESYDLIDLSDVQRIPLFPLSTVSNTSTLKPIVFPFGKDEFMMCCGGTDESDNAMGMVVNINGDISRGTIPWDSYPSSLTVDFPYSIGVFNSKKTVIVHSSLDQSKVQSIKFPDSMAVKVQSVSHVFDSKNTALTKILFKSPLVSSGSVEESEKVAIESDEVHNNVHVFSSTILYDIHGKIIKILQPLPSPIRLVNLFNSATETNFRAINQSLMDELRSSENNAEPSHISKLTRELVYVMLGILALKFQHFDQCFEIWCNPQNDLDPRLVIYMILGNDASIFGSLWQFEYLFPAFNEVKEFYNSLENRKQVDEFNTVFLNTWVSNSDFIKDPDVMKSLEMSLIKSEINTASNENDILETLKNIKVCKKEIEEYLHHENKYYLIAKYYESLNDHRQFLYYWSNLIKGEFKDNYYEKNFTKEKSLQFFINYMVKYCPKDEATIWKYGEWLISDYPAFGIKLFTSPSLDKMQINDLKILQSLDKNPDMKFSYLEYMLIKKNEKQFIGDYILELLKTLLKEIEPYSENLSKLIAEYPQLEPPKMTFPKFLKIQKNKFVKPEVIELGLKLYHYLLMINDETVSIVDRKNVIAEVSNAVEPYKLQLPLVSITLNYKKKEYQKVVEGLCELHDFTSAERFANTLKLSEELNDDFQLTESEKSESESLLLVVFDFYLKLNDSTLIEKFLNNHNIITTSETFDSIEGSNTNKVEDSIDRFIFLLNRLPNNFPVAQIQNFLIHSIINFETNYTDTLLQKNLAKSQNSSYAKCLKEMKKEED